jgi:adenylate kinase
VKQRVIILLGPPGGGKGTQAARLSAGLKLPHISTGDLFRENRAKGTELGKRAQTYMDAGKLVPDELVLDMLFDRVSRSDCKHGYLLDGFPRTLAQAARSTRASRPGERAGDQSARPARSHRRPHRRSTHVRGVRQHPPREDLRAEDRRQVRQVRGTLVQRTDDTPEVVEKRLAAYREQTQPLESYYAKNGLLRKSTATARRTTSSRASRSWPRATRLPDGQGRTDHGRSSGHGSAAERALPRQARVRPRDPGARERQDADALHPDPARRQDHGGDVALRPHQGTHHLPRRTSKARRFDESTKQRSPHVRELQDHPAPWCRPSHLLGHAPQATSRAREQGVNEKCRVSSESTFRPTSASRSR